MARIFNPFPWRRRPMEEDLDSELRHHMDLRVEDLRRSGLNEAEARRRAALELGGIAQAQDEVRDVWRWRWLDDRYRDLRYAGRMLVRSPGFTAAAMLSLALGIGANAGIFSLFDQVLLRPLPIAEPERLVHLDWVGPSLATAWGNGNLMSYPLCRDLQEQEQFFDGVFCRHPTTVTLSAGQQHDPVRADVVSGSYFSVLGVRPELGRLIDRSDDLQPGAHPVVVLSYSYWRNNFGGDEGIVGRNVLVNNYPMTVIGIAPASFRGVDLLASPALWIPAMMTEQAARIEPQWDRLLDRRTVWMHVFARLRPGTTAEQARDALQPWFKAMLEGETRLEGFPSVAAEQRRNFLESTIDVLPAAQGLSNVRGSLERPLWVLMGGTTLLLLLASLNVASLLLARGAARSRELATRMALGASQGRIAGQLLVETMLITLGGGLLGRLLAPAVSQLLLLLLSQGDLAVQIDRRVFLFAFVASMVTAGVCGLAPVLQIGRIPLFATLKEKSRITAAGGVLVRKVLVGGQMALTLVLLIGAGLFLQTLARLHEKVEVASGSLLMFSLDPPSSGYSEADAEQAMRELFRTLQAVPGVESVAVANTRLLTGGATTALMTIQADERIVSDRPVSYMRVGPGFFSTLGMQIVAGRDFDERDIRGPGSEPTPWRSVVVNESFARRYFKGRSPVGARLGTGNRPDTKTDVEIIGVVRDFSRRSLRDQELEQAFFSFWDNQSGDGAFYLKTRGRPESAFAQIRATVAQVDPILPVFNMTTFEDQIDRSLSRERMLATLSTAFGLIALLLSVVGLYGVMSFVVTHRTQEIGVRMALGATRPAVVWLIVRDALVVIGAGIAVALPCAWVLRRLVESQIFGVGVVDGPTILAASGLLALVALVAAMLPAWRAASVSPTEALRFE